MSDSDTDLLPNNVHTFQSQGTTVSARGPNINSTNISSLSFRNNVMTSTMDMPWNWNMDRPRYAESVYDQRSMYYNRERETSMSLHSASGMHSRNLHHSYYPGAMSSHRSTFNGRSGSPMSVRTIDSNTSISAKDIAFAFENGTFNEFDFKVIKEAYNRFMKSRTRKRVEKRRNIRMFLKGFRRRSGGDSGDQASNSSISSDDARSIRTSRSTVYKQNMSSCRSTKTDISDFRRTVRESKMVKDCSDNFRQNSFKSMFSAGSSRERENNLQQKWQNNSMANSISHMQRDRFKNGFLLPSQRFNHSVAALPIPEKPNRQQKINEGNLLDVRSNGPNKIFRQDRNNLDTDSEQEEIFANVTVMEKTSFSKHAKRILEEDDVPMSDKKRTKLSPPKNNPKPKNPIQNQPNAVINQKSNEFVFAKPQRPLKKPTIAKQQKLVSKSAQPKSAQQPIGPPPKENAVMPTADTDTLKPVELPVEKVISGSKKAVDKLILKSSQPLESVKKISEKEVVQSIEQEKENCLPTDITLHSTTDMSMRPSFIKRKLFTQKVDVAEKNSSSDSLQADSPQTNVYSKTQKEKNRARKLVTTQSCLNRDIGDDSNLLDLIHKIVPADRMNVTNAANRTNVQNNRSKPANHHKWDVTSVITSCDNTDDASDTYTDEEIFTDEKQQQNKISKLKNEDNLKVSKLNEHIKDKPQESKQKVANVVKQKSVVKGHNINNEMPKSPQCKPANQQIQKTSKFPNYKVEVQKFQRHNLKEPTSVLNEPIAPTERNGLIHTYKGVKSFWGTDTESDLEATPLKRAGPKNAVAKNLETVATPAIIEATPLKRVGSKNAVVTHPDFVATPPKNDAAPPKRAVSKNAVVTNPETAEAPPKKVIAPGNKLPQNGIKQKTPTKATATDVTNPGTAEAPPKKVIAPGNKLPQNGIKQKTPTKATATDVTNPGTAEAPPKKVIAPGNKLPQNGIKQKTPTKATATDVTNPGTAEAPPKKVIAPGNKLPQNGIKQKTPTKATATVVTNLGTAETPPKKVIAPGNKLPQNKIKQKTPTKATATVVTNPGTAEAPPKKVIAPGNKLPQNKIKQKTPTKATAKRKLNSSLLNKEKETKVSNQIRKPRNIALSVEKDVVSNKTKTVEKTVKGKKISASTTENKRPLEKSNEVAKNVHNTSLNLQKDFILQQKDVKKATSKKAMSKIINNDSTLSNNELQFNHTLRIRRHRTPTVIKYCCGEQHLSHNVSKNNSCNNSTLYRSLRSREINISTSFQSDDFNITRNKKTAPKNIRPAKNNKVSNIVKGKTTK